MSAFSALIIRFAVLFKRPRLQSPDVVFLITFVYFLSFDLEWTFDFHIRVDFSFLL